MAGYSLTENLFVVYTTDDLGIMHETKYPLLLVNDYCDAHDCDYTEIAEQLSKLLLEEPIS